MSEPEAKPDLQSLPQMILDGDEPVFSAPWEAQAFALTISLYEKGLFTWAEWADHLSAEVHSGENRDYYQHWLVALEKLMAIKQVTSPEEVERREQAWHAAAARTPHGQPIKL